MDPNTAKIMAGVVGALLGITISSIPGSIQIHLGPAAITHCRVGPTIDVPVWLVGELAG